MMLRQRLLNGQKKVREVCDQTQACIRQTGFRSPQDKKRQVSLAKIVVHRQQVYTKVQQEQAWTQPTKAT